MLRGARDDDGGSEMTEKMTLVLTKEDAEFILSEIADGSRIAFHRYLDTGNDYYERLSKRCSKTASKLRRQIYEKGK